MYQEIAVLLLAVAIVCVLVATYRMRSKNNARALSSKQIQGKDQESFADSLSELTLPQLEYKLRKLEGHLIIVSSGFISMNRIQQQRVIERVKDIKSEVNLVKETLEQRRLSR